MCIAVLEKVDGMLEGKAKTNKLKIEAAIDSFCGKKDLSQQDKKLVREADGGLGLVGGGLVGVVWGEARFWGWRVWCVGVSPGPRRLALEG